MALTGDPDGDPLAPPSPAPLVLDEHLAPWGLDAGVLAERAAILGLRRGGQRSCGGATRLLRCADGWVATSLARPEDVEDLPAWLGVAPGTGRDGDPWPVVAAAVAGRPAAELVAGAAVLGLPCASPGEAAAADPVPAPLEALPDLAGRRVVDLASLWAGPLCADLLRRAGATVVKVEDVHRPDGGRQRPRFHDLLNAGKASVALDLADPGGRAALGELVRAADVVVTSARRRAFEHLGLVPADVVASSAQAAVWVAITGHGWAVDRVGFGDDAAVAGGLVAWHPDDGAPRLVADAVADPITGVLAAVDAVRGLRSGEPTVVDRSLAGTAAALRADGPARAAEPGTVVSPPRPRSPEGTARPLGADTAAVVGAWSR